ncbi:MAG: ATP-binding protein [Syntrophales bacterium]|jgi:PAS domain S-box-containing protein
MGKTTSRKSTTRQKRLQSSVMDHIHAITALLTEMPDLGAVFNKILDGVMDGLKFDRAVIMLLNQDSSILECRCIRGFTAKGERLAWEKPFQMDHLDCYETRVVKTGRPIVLSDTPADTDATELDRLINQFQERLSLLYVPLRVKGKVLGFIGADRYKTHAEITREDLEALILFANQASIVIENARLYNELSEKTSLLEGVVKSSVDGIIVSDIMGHVLHCNPKAEEILGITEEEARGMEVRQLAALDEQERNRLYRVFKRKENISHYIKHYTRRDGKQLLLNLNCFAIVRESGETLGVVTELTDITEKKRMDDYLVRVEKFAALGHIASVIAHEIRNPLAGIFTTVQNLESDIADGLPQKTDLQNIMAEVDRLEKLLREILDLARPLPLQCEEVDIKDLLKATMDLLTKDAAKKDVVLRTEFHHGDVCVMADSGRLRQVFLNLLINAMDAISTRGEIIVATEMLPALAEQAPRMVISFRDNGIGIPSVHLNRIFDPFFTTKKIGTGLGLAVSHRIIQDHKGMIEVESRVGVGTTFRITLPVMTET